MTTDRRLFVEIRVCRCGSALRLVRGVGVEAFALRGRECLFVEIAQCMECGGLASRPPSDLELVIDRGTWRSLVRLRDLANFH